MLKVLIVDDEVLVKVGLRNIIAWQEHDYEIIGEASNGQQALEIARRTPPDIVLTDIRMPAMDGIELVRCLREEQPQAKIIILTAYKDFEYVQQAMRLGVTEYILKLSMEPDDLLQVLDRVKRQIEMERSQPSFSLSLHQMEQRSLFFRSPEETIPDFPLPDFPARIVLLRLAHFSNGTPASIARLLERVFGAASGPFYLSDHWFGVLLPEDELLTEEKLKDRRENILKEIQAEIRMGVSGLIFLPAEMRSALEQARRAVRHGFYISEKDIIFSETLPPYVTVNQHEEWKAIEEAVLTPSRMEEACRRVLALDCARQKRFIPPQDAVNLCLTLLRAIAFALREVGFSQAEMEIPQRYETMDALKDQVQKTWEIYTQYRENRFSADIVAIIRYVQEHYSQPIRLCDVAGMVYRSESYISYLFREKMGVGFVDYVTRVRIEKAKELLLQEGVSISSVPERVGFSDPAYFCRVFKKITHVSPQRYRQSEKKN